MIYSVRDNDETVVVAGNQLGKDYVAGFIAVSAFLCPFAYWPKEYVYAVEATRSAANPHPHAVRIVATSVRDDHLDVLFGEANRFITGAEPSLLESKGGPLLCTHHNIRRVVGRNRLGPELCPISYVSGIVSKKGEGMAGHHAPYTLFIGDEASGIEDTTYEAAQGWAKKMLIFGNPLPCENFFRKAVDGGDLPARAR